MLGGLGDLRGDATLGKYRIVLGLGQGGTADVYLAVADGPDGFHKLVVLKVLKQSLAGDPEFRVMFASEARLAARLHHPNVVQTNEVLDLDGWPAMVMEYLDGQPLSQVIVRGRDNGFTLAMQLRVLIDALAGLHAAHELRDVDGTPLGVVHRDVSPQNLFVTVEGQAKVLDFGIAKLAHSEVETAVGTTKGKLRYMAPEQIAGEPLDRRADVYAAGVILWEALAGERMWKSASEAQIRARVARGELPAAGALRGDLPPALERICRRALALAPRDRHATALDLADDLEEALPALGRQASHREIGATVARLFADVRAETRGAIEQKLGPLRESGPHAGQPSRHPGTHESAPHELPPAPPVATPLAASSTPRSSRRRRALLVAIPAGALAVGLAAGLAVWSGGSGSHQGAQGGAHDVVRPPAVPAAAPRAEPAPTAALPASPAGEPPAPPAGVEARKDQQRRARPPGVTARAAREHGQRPAAAAPAPAAAGAAPGPAVDCSHPFFVDLDGIKKVRAECR